MTDPRDSAREWAHRLARMDPHNWPPVEFPIGWHWDAAHEIAAALAALQAERDEARTTAADWRMQWESTHAQKQAAEARGAARGRPAGLPRRGRAVDRRASPMTAEARDPQGASGPTKSGTTPAGATAGALAREIVERTAADLHGRGLFPSNDFGRPCRATLHTWTVAIASALAALQAERDEARSDRVRLEWWLRHVCACDHCHECVRNKLEATMPYRLNSCGEATDTPDPMAGEPEWMKQIARLVREKEAAEARGAALTKALLALIDECEPPGTPDHGAPSRRTVAAARATLAETTPTRPEPATMGYVCPVCGFDGMAGPPNDFEICPRCGTEFGNDDFTDVHSYSARVAKWHELRRAWISGGRKWFDAPESPA